MKISLVLLAFILIAHHISAQKIRTINRAVGCQTLYPNLTLEQVKIKAIQQAKLYAFQEAGFEEEISISQLLNSTNSNEIQSDQFFETIVSGVKGEISYFELLDEKQEIGAAGEIILCVEAKITVVQYPSNLTKIKSPNLDGIKEAYTNGEKLTFRLRFLEDGWAWVFVMDSDAVFHQIYPSSYDLSHAVNSDNWINFPRTDLVSWVLNTESIFEKNEVIIVFSNKKQNEPSALSLDFNNWSDWYQQIAYENRIKISKPIQIISD